ncbi:MAG: serine hydrolase [Candidatus Binatia bacterium]|nr:serine hydrolase [Candidatus Binatia bacterium]
MSQFGAQPAKKPTLLPLPPHPEGLAWPTQEWPRDELDPRVDRASLDRLLDHAFTDPGPDDLELTYGVVVVQHGAIVAERYSPSVSPDDAFLSWSMAKSITNSLIGILVRQGKLDISKPISVKEWSAGDPRSRITIDQMLRMVDGLRFREAEHLGGGSVRYYDENESDVIPMLFGAGKNDTAGFASTLPYLAPPEERWNYNSGASNLLSRLVRETIGGGEAEMLEFMREELFEPLGMTTADPKFDAAGNFIGSATCYCSIRDFARFGYLFLRDGEWDGRRILPAGWADYCRTPTLQSDGTYGAHFWTIPGSLGIFYCSGMGGQRVLISPKLDLIVTRMGKTSPHKVAAVVQYCKELIDAFRPTAD